MEADFGSANPVLLVQLCSLLQSVERLGWDSLGSLLGGIFEGANEFGHIVFVVVAGLASRLAHVTDEGLKGLVLLGTNLLDDVGEHILEFLGFARAGHDEKVLADRELDYNLKGQ